MTEYDTERNMELVAMIVGFLCVVGFIGLLVSITILIITC